MNITKLIIGAIAGGIVLFLLGWLIYGNLLAGFMHDNPGRIGHRVERKEIEFMYLIIGNLLQGMLLAYVLLKSNVNSIGSGAVTGGIVGFLSCAAVDSIIYATTFMTSKKAIAADVIAFTVMCAIAGAVIAVVAGKKGS